MLSCIYLQSSIVQWSVIPSFFCFDVDVDVRILDQILHNLQFTPPEERDMPWMINKFDHAVVSDHTVCAYI